MENQVSAASGLGWDSTMFTGVAAVIASLLVFGFQLYIDHRRTKRERAIALFLPLQNQQFLEMRLRAFEHFWAYAREQRNEPVGSETTCDLGTLYRYKPTEVPAGYDGGSCVSTMLHLMAGIGELAKAKEIDLTLARALFDPLFVHFYEEVGSRLTTAHRQAQQVLDSSRFAYDALRSA